MLWEALHSDLEPGSPPRVETPELRGALYAELVIRGLQKAVPRLAEYLAEDGSLQASFSVDGGYYTKTPDNLPLIGPLPDAPLGIYVCAGLSGYGIMAANAAGELLASHVANAPLPESYANHFLPERWLSSAYRASIQSVELAPALQI